MNRLWNALIAAGLSFLMLVPGVPVAQEAYPSRPITFIFPFPPGTPHEAVYRVLFEEAEKLLGQPIVIVNRTGAGFTIAANAIARAKPDGYTIGYPGSSSLFLAPFLQDLPYHPLKDFQPIAQFSSVTFGVLVKGDSSFKTIRDLLAHGRQQPKKLTYGTNGNNTIQYFVMEQLLKNEASQLTHVPYRGAPDVYSALLGGHIDIGAVAPSHPLIESGQHRLLLVLADERAPQYPDVPSLKDLGHDIPVPAFVGASGPVGLPPEIVKRLDDALGKATTSPSVVQRAQQLRIPLVYRNSKDLSDYIARCYEAYGRMVKEFATAK